MKKSSKKQVGLGFITEVDRYLFGNGTHYEIYEKLGAHPVNCKGKDGMYFACLLYTSPPPLYTPSHPPGK